MNLSYCWHRPGRLHRSTRLCRFCGIGIEECPCGPRKRSELPCPCCEGSGWVGIVRSKAAMVAEVWTQPDTQGAVPIDDLPVPEYVERPVRWPDNVACFQTTFDF